MLLNMRSKHGDFGFSSLALLFYNLFENHVYFDGTPESKKTQPTDRRGKFVLHDIMITHAHQRAGYIRALLEQQLTNPPTNNQSDNVPPQDSYNCVPAASVHLHELRLLAIVATDVEVSRPPDLAKLSAAGCVGA
ncbi:hypothetical protein FRC12_013726 [Ceratobasidium sp. 428]|nr:hypothetical protein FRC12_013726 [Ceratobasidium sp. 428]